MLIVSLLVLIHYLCIRKRVIVAIGNAFTFKILFERVRCIVKRIPVVIVRFFVTFFL